MRDRKSWSFLFTWNQDVPTVTAWLAELEKFYEAHMDVLVADPGDFRCNGPAFTYVRLDTTPTGLRALRQFTGGVGGLPSAGVWA